MRRRISYVLLAFAVLLLVAVLIDRARERREFLNPKYHAALYWGHIDAIDSVTKEHVDFELDWDLGERSPFLKGSPPSIIEQLSDGSKMIMIVAAFDPAPFQVSVKASGYRSRPATLSTMSSGIVRKSYTTSLEIVELTKTGRSEASGK